MPISLDEVYDSGFVGIQGVLGLWRKIKEHFIQQGSKLTDKLTITGNGKLQLNNDGSVVDEDDKPLLNITTEFDEDNKKTGYTLNFGNTDYAMNLKGNSDAPIYINEKGESFSFVTTTIPNGVKINFSSTPPTDADDNTITFVIR